MKKFIHYSLMFLLVIVLSLFINIKTSDKIEVNAAGPKSFEVGDVLPVTTQLRISWIKSLQTTDAFRISTKYDSNFIYYLIDGEDYDTIHINGVYIYTYDDGFISPYTDVDGAHAYIVINTSSWSLDERTISSVDDDGYFVWEDLNAQYYRIFFNTNGGNSIPSITSDIIPDNLPIPKRNNDIFIGWYYDELLSDPVETNDILSSNIILYASWIDYDSITEYFNDIYNDGFDDGYNDSINDLFNQGYDIGYSYGYDEGYNEGYQDGLMEDHPIEYQEFYEKGFSDARDKYGKQLNDYQWESAQIAYENGQKTMGKYTKFLIYGIVIITIIGGVLLYFSLKRRNE